MLPVPSSGRSPVGKEHPRRGFKTVDCLLGTGIESVVALSRKRHDNYELQKMLTFYVPVKQYRT